MSGALATWRRDAGCTWWGAPNSTINTAGELVARRVERALRSLDVVSDVRLSGRRMPLGQIAALIVASDVGRACAPSC